MRFWSCLYVAILLFPSLVLATQLQVTIKGVPPEIEKNIRNDLHLQQATTEEKLTEPRIKNLYQLANEQITETLQAKGFYNSSIESDLAVKDQDKWTAAFNIKLGKPTKIETVTIVVTGPGKNNPKIRPFYRTPKLIPGHIIVHENYEDTKDELLADFNSIGYLQADFTQSVIEVDRNNYTANVKFTIDSGVQYTFGKITFVDSTYDYDFLIRFVPFHAGDDYDLNKLMQFQSNLEGADLFSKIRFDPQIDLNNSHNTVVPIEVRLENKPKNRYSGSAGYGTDTGFRGSLGWLHRRTSTDGHKIFANVNASQVRSLARVNYIIPGSRPATDKYVLGALGQIESFEELLSRKAEVSASKIMKRGKMESMYGLWYFTETFRIVHAQPTLNKKYLLPTIKWLWVDSKETDEFEFGTRFDIRLRGGIQGVLSDTSVAEIEINAKKIFPLTEVMRLLLRTNLGAVASGNFDQLPPSLRFFTGGDTSVRGFAYNSLGPLAVPSDPDSNTGGRFLAVFSGEIERKLYEKFSGVVFFDAGNTAQSTKIPLAFGTGVGVRYKTPVGLFRLDLAKPLNTVVNKHWRVHFNFGMDL